MTQDDKADFTLLSSSPRRREIVSAFSGRVRVAGSRGAEPRSLDGEAPVDYVLRCAVAKLGTAPFDSDAGCLVGADTVVALDGDILGKPESDGDARAMLRRLRNRWHEVVTGVAVLDLATRRTVTGSESSAVLTRDYSDEEIDKYVARREPLDKAGGYAVQDGDFAPRVERRGLLSERRGSATVPSGRAAAQSGCRGQIASSERSPLLWQVYRLQAGD